MRLTTGNRRSRHRGLSIGGHRAIIVVDGDQQQGRLQQPSRRVVVTLIVPIEVSI